MATPTYRVTIEVEVTALTMKAAMDAVAGAIQGPGFSSVSIASIEKARTVSYLNDKVPEHMKAELERICECRHPFRLHTRWGGAPKGQALTCIVDGRMCEHKCERFVEAA